MSKYHIQIYCDGGIKAGYGHISRSKSLCSFLIGKGFNSSIYGISDESNFLIGEKSFENKDAEIVLFDSHRNLDKLIIKEKKKNKFVITLDWFGKEKPDYNIIIHPHSKPKAKIKCFIGFEYIIIRDEILLLKKTKKIKNKALVCIGGGDVLDQSYLAAEYLYHKGLNVTVVNGKTNEKSLTSKKFEVLNNPKNFPELLAESSFVVTNGGGCMFESIYLNTLTWALPQTKFEKNVVNSVFDSNYIVGQGINSLKSLELDKLEQKNKGTLIDGLGKNRIFNIIQKII